MRTASMRVAWMRVAAIVAVVGFVAAGCGDDAERLSQAEFLEQGNAVCAGGNERIDEMFEATFESEQDFEDEAKQETAKAALEDDIQSQIDDIDDLEPPEDIEDAVDSLVDSAQAALDEIREMSTADFFAEEEDPFEDVNRQAAEIGLTECAEGGEEDEGEGGDEEAAPGAAVVEVTATEYAFEPASTTLAAGLTALHLVNGGQEDHELSIARIADGHTLQEALEFEGDPEEAGLIVEPTGHAFAEPGQDSYINVELVPGNYGMVCFVEAEDGTPHAFKGMALEFTVS
jgi:plastocyanin